MTRAMLITAIVLAAASAWAQPAPSGVVTPAPVPLLPATDSPTVIPEKIAPPSGTAGPANATPFSSVPSGTGGNPTSPAPNVSK